MMFATSPKHAATTPETLSSTLRPYVSALWQIDERQALALLDPEALFSAYQQGLG
ncbi:hypothetical protein HSBAA_58420 [Vreelandella sulfidaeris]|uniref:Uncharacterized protein n=1 Tax=Vreelandella sulfidaeris TaxID=115553 RepID=A0A455UE27_9GAMM|nr:hypothetical protein HSBAA_58420 [Halomonas sulfidaeris]